MIFFNYKNIIKKLIEYSIIALIVTMLYLSITCNSCKQKPAVIHVQRDSTEEIQVQTLVWTNITQAHIIDSLTAVVDTISRNYESLKKENKIKNENYQKLYNELKNNISRIPDDSLYQSVRRELARTNR